MLLRAEAKYAMGAYKGTKKDVLQYFGDSGVSETTGQRELALVVLSVRHSQGKYAAAPPLPQRLLVAIKTRIKPEALDQLRKMMI